MKANFYFNVCVAVVVILFFLLFPGKAVMAQRLKLINLQCEYRSNPLAVESMTPKLSWQIIASERNTLQTAYRILVADNPSLLKKNNGNIWDSKKIVSDASIQVIYNGKKLEATKTYYWKVMIWDNKGHSSAWSSVAKWQNGLFSKEDWNGAHWIAYEKMHDSLLHLPSTSEWQRKPVNDILPLFRKEFVAKKTIKQATIFISGLGHFDLTINGRKAGDHFMDAGWTDYLKKALYVNFDITDLLQQGNNAIGVMLGNGFYFMPGERYLKLQLAYGYPKMICRVVVQYTDGSTENIISDESWKTSPGPVTFSSIYGGEDYNALLEQQGWNKISFNESKWKKVIIVDGPPQLMSQTAEPVKVFENFLPKKITEAKPGVWVYDLGQNASGIPEISLKGKKGSTVRMWPAELLDKDGTITTKPIGTPVYFDYTLKGDGIETWHPKFMYYGFRYVQIETAVPEGESNEKKLPSIISLKLLHTRNAAVRVGEFSCSNDLFNKTDALIDWAIRSNMSSILTDCPHREKLGWLEEAHLVGPSIRYNFDIASLCRKIVQDMMTAQNSNGLVPSIAPQYAVFPGAFSDSPEWGSNAIIMPWYLYQWYGDKQLLEEAYPMMQRFITYLKSKAKNNILSHGLGDWYDIGPKEPGPSQLTPQGITATAVYYYDLMILNKIATLLGKNEEATGFLETATAVKNSYNNSFFNKTKMQYGSGSQTANAISLYMDLVEPQYKEAVLSNMIKGIKNNNNSLTAGDIGYRYLLRVLDDNERSDIIYDMNSNAGVPGYGYQLSRGATALTESWQGNENASNNHMMLGHLKEWFYSGLAGIRPAPGAVAFNKIEIKPQPVGDVTSASANYNSPYGFIKSEWKKNNNDFQLTAEIPVNTTALIYLPAIAASVITESNKAVSKNSAIKLLTVEKGRAIIAVGSGTYLFNVQ